MSFLLLLEMHRSQSHKVKGRWKFWERIVIKSRKRRQKYRDRGEKLKIERFIT
jgi:hypothetical protein